MYNFLNRIMKNIGNSEHARAATIVAWRRMRPKNNILNTKRCGFVRSGILNTASGINL